MREVEVFIIDKQKYLNENYPKMNVPTLVETRNCIHCGEIITVGDYRVYMDECGEEVICCPNAPKCDGTAMDWL